MGGRFEIPAGKLADRLSVMVYLLGLRCWLADWRIREVVRSSAAAVPAVVRRAPGRPYRRSDTVLAATYEHHGRGKA